MHNNKTGPEGRFRQPVRLALARPEDTAQINALRDTLRFVDYAEFQKDPKVLLVSNDPKGLTVVCKASLDDGTIVATARFGLCFTKEELVRHLCAEYTPGPGDFPILASGRAAALKRNDSTKAPTPAYGGHRALRDVVVQLLRALRWNGMHVKSQMGANALGGESGLKLNPLPIYLGSVLGYQIEEATSGSFIYKGRQCTNKLTYEDAPRVISLHRELVLNGSIPGWTWEGPLPFADLLPPGWLPRCATTGVNPGERW